MEEGGGLASVRRKQIAMLSAAFSGNEAAPALNQDSMSGLNGKGLLSTDKSFSRAAIALPLRDRLEAFKKASRLLKPGGPNEGGPSITTKDGGVSIEASTSSHPPSKLTSTKKKQISLPSPTQKTHTNAVFADITPLKTSLSHSERDAVAASSPSLMLQKNNKGRGVAAASIRRSIDKLSDPDWPPSISNPSAKPQRKHGGEEVISPRSRRGVSGGERGASPPQNRLSRGTSGGNGGVERKRQASPSSSDDEMGKAPPIKSQEGWGQPRGGDSLHKRRRILQHTDSRAKGRFSRGDRAKAAKEDEDSEEEDESPHRSLSKSSLRHAENNQQNDFQRGGKLWGEEVVERHPPAPLERRQHSGSSGARKLPTHRVSKEGESTSSKYAGKRGGGDFSLPPHRPRSISKEGNPPLSPHHSSMRKDGMLFKTKSRRRTSDSSSSDTFRGVSSFSEQRLGGKEKSLSLQPKVGGFQPSGARGGASKMSASGGMSAKSDGNNQKLPSHRGSASETHEKRLFGRVFREKNGRVEEEDEEEEEDEDEGLSSSSWRGKSPKMNGKNPLLSTSHSINHKKLQESVDSLGNQGISSLKKAHTRSGIGFREKESNRESSKHTKTINQMRKTSDRHLKPSRRSFSVERLVEEEEDEEGDEEGRGEEGGGKIVAQRVWSSSHQQVSIYGMSKRKEKSSHAASENMHLQGGDSVRLSLTNDAKALEKSLAMASQPEGIFILRKDQLIKAKKRLSNNVKQNITSVPIYAELRHSAGVMGMMEIGPGTQYGPVRNDKGFLSCLVSSCELERLKFDSGLREGNPVRCMTGMQIVIAPNDVYGFRNDSKTTPCNIFVVACDFPDCEEFDPSSHIDAIEAEFDNREDDEESTTDEVDEEYEKYIQKPGLGRKSGKISSNSIKNHHKSVEDEGGRGRFLPLSDTRQQPIMENSHANFPRNRPAGHQHQINLPVSASGRKAAIKSGRK